MAKATTSWPSARLRLAAWLVVASLLAGGLAGCLQPKDETPGYRLRGELVEAPVRDWSFASAVREVFLETTPWYRIPHSTTLWCAEIDGELYVGSYGPGNKKRWEENVLRRPEARIRIEGQLYDVTLKPVADEATTRSLDVAYATKYDMVAVFGDDVPEWWYYTVEQRN